MKKFIGLLLILSLVSCFAACGGNETLVENSDNSVIDNVDDNKNIASNKELTIDDVKNAPVSPESDFEVYKQDKGVQIYSYIGDDEIVVIPETINGKPVISFYGAFNNSEHVRAIKFPDNVEVIEENTTLGADNLEYVVFGKNTKIIETFAVPSNCLKGIEINESIEVIEDSAFPFCKNVSSLYIPKSLENIEYMNPFGFELQDALIYCVKGSSAERFALVNKLKYEYVGDEEIPAPTFPEYNPRNYSEEIKNLMSLPATDESYFEIVEEFENGVSVRYTGSDIETLVFPETIEGKKIIKLAEQCIDTFVSVKNVVISDSVEVIESGAFLSGASYENIIFGKNVKIIEDGRLTNANSLRNIILNEGLESIGDDVFTSGTKSLKEIYFPSSLTTVSGAFNEDMYNHINYTIICEYNSEAELAAIRNGASPENFKIVTVVND